MASAQCCFVRAQSASGCISKAMQVLHEMLDPAPGDEKAELSNVAGLALSTVQAAASACR